MDNRTDEIIQRFKTSWTEVEECYDIMLANGGFDRLKPLRHFISDLRQKGEDKYFRAGTSMYTFILSRSVDFGLRVDQKYIRIEPFDNNAFEVTLRDGYKAYREYRLTNLTDVRLTKLLQTLKDTLVD